VTAIQTQFATSFTLIQDGIRSVEQVLRETDRTLVRIVQDLDESNWNNLRQQDSKLRDEIALIDSRYAASKDDINTNNAQLEASLNEVLVGQVMKGTSSIPELNLFLV
jgi:uncharacterized protein involved in exopolysaccharide biosynthesis